jgi:type II secretory pathway pseudopilin PulG
MKKLSLFLVVIFLITIVSSFQELNGQGQTKADQEKEQQIKMAIDEQKKAMAEQQKAIKEHQYIMEDSLNNIQVEVRNDGEGRNIMKYFSPRGNRSFVFDEPFDVSTGMNDFYGHSMGDSERTTWDFSKSVKEKTFSNEFSFDVEKTANTVVMSVMGDCKTGEIRIKIIMPSGKNYSDVVIDESGNLNWRKSFTISEKENQDKAGAWKFKIDSNKATGFFKISLQTY